MLRTNILQILIDKNSYKSYLEIGLGNGKNFENIVIDEKISVDPNQEYNAIHQVTSDEYFEHNTNNFDIVLVDGLHHADQVYIDIQNSLKVLNTGGAIVCHDMNPKKEEHQTIPFNGGHWNGDCWKALVELRKNHTDLKVYTVDTDEGCAVIQKIEKGSEKFSTDLDLNWENFDANRNEWLNLISTDDFLQSMNIPFNTQDLIKQYILNPEDPETNWKMALHYHDIGQTAAAVGFYVRCAERTEDVLLQYESMIRAAMCFQMQGIRKFSVRGMLQHAVCLLPERPEAYYKLGIILANEHGDGSWFDCYTYSSLGLSVTKPIDELPKLRTVVDYPGIHELKFQNAYAAWHCGNCAESKQRHIEMYNDPDLPEYLKHRVKNNLVLMKAFVTEQIEYFKRADTFELIHRFPGVDSILKNLSESFQDMFVLSMLDGKKKGTYLEIGAGQPFYGNNTALLENNFEWTGISLDISEQFVKEYSEQRKNICLLRDATTTNFETLLQAMNMPAEIDYLQIDCDPPENSFKALLNIPFDTRKFAVITFEHDHYSNEESDIRDKSRKYLEAYGYKLVVNNIAPDNWRAYEDWWVHPDLVNEKIIDKFLLVNDDVKKAKDYMLGKIK